MIPTNPRHRRRRTALATMASLALSLTVAGCSDGQAATDEGAILRVALQKPTTLIPGNSSGLFADTVVDTLFDGLVEYEPGTGDVRNLVASSIESEDQRTWQIELKAGWTFQNGEPVDAESFARAWNAAVDPDNAWVQSSQFSGIDGYADVVDGKADSLRGVVVEGELRLTVTLSSPNSQFPYLLGRPYYSPIPQAALDDPESFAAQPIGNGPYAMTEPWTGGDAIRTEAFADYAGAKQKNAGVTFRIYTGNDVAYTDYEAGAVDIVNLNPADIPKAQSSYPGLVRRMAKDNWRNYLSLPTYLPGFDDARIRKALSMAIDREAIISSLLDGEARVATDYDIPVSPGYRDDACGEICIYDRAAAKALWDAAGGIEGGLTITSVTGTGREIWAEAIANQWSEAFGVDVKVQQVASENTWSGILNREVRSPVALGAPANYPSPLDTLGPSYSSGGTVNGSFYDSSEFDELLNKAAAAADPEDQLAFYGQAKDVLIEDSPSVLLWTYPSTFVVSQRASSYEPDPFNKGAFGSVTIEE